MKKIVGAVILLTVLGAAGYFYFKQPPKVQYKTLKVERGAITSTVSATGTLNAVVTVQVGTQVSGTIAKLYVDFNSPVKKGQPIAQIDPALFNSAVQQSRGNALNAEASLAKSKVTLADAKRTLGRNRELLKEGIIAQSDLDAAQTAYDSALTGVKAAEATVLQTRGALKQAETNLNYSTIRSPVDGTVVSRNVDVGQTVAASFQTPTLFTIAQDLTKMQIDTSVDESDISKLQIGQKATFTVDAYSDRQFEGKVVQIRNAPVVTQNVVTYVTVIAVDNKELKLKPGMTANVTVETLRKDNLLKVPAAALRFKPRSDKEKPGAAKNGAGGSAGPGGMTGAGGGRGAGAGPKGKGGGKEGGQKVYKLSAEGKPVPVAITTGISDGSYVEVLTGNLKEGDDVVVEQLSQDKKKGGMGSPMGPRF
ncbi:efflux RND transporter periplasmic adaptor subunit [Geomonas sp. Red69]|uniref:Efflux RND transporter periplasmic adaptor subunit n=1 Tax=Geomonas diazotrophica TaxID=2843197 RepID=A0ABX8JPA8_9BACT|nr:MULTISPECIES: efflux RND transporter periplasmic adaptor subunit [Geomonas]MBU5637107.1 efflux RND transporter periplasmic adaptor subunit [Geomonas diazotrophica]QWV99407.1 efflux RND transporter periplasmic adaptor subunit [Geomonas nitrogeniifigens]